MVETPTTEETLYKINGSLLTIHTKMDEQTKALQSIVTALETIAEKISTEVNVE